MIYREYDSFPVEARKRQIVAAFQQGVTAERLPKQTIDAHEEHKKNVEALERTLKIFADFPPKRRTIQRLQERLRQERYWVEHYDTCIAEYKRGRERLSALMKNADFKVVVETIVRKEVQNKPLKKASDNTDKKEDSGMVTKMMAPVDPTKLRGAERRRWFMANRAA